MNVTFQKYCKKIFINLTFWSGDWPLICRNRGGTSASQHHPPPLLPFIASSDEVHACVSCAENRVIYPLQGGDIFVLAQRAQPFPPILICRSGDHPTCRLMGYVAVHVLSYRSSSPLFLISELASCLLTPSVKHNMHLISFQLMTARWNQSISRQPGREHEQQTKNPGRGHAR